MTILDTKAQEDRHRNGLIVMLGTSLDTMGGISAVVSTYKDAGLFERWPIVYISTHAAGDFRRKAKIVAAAMARYLHLLLTGQVDIVHVHSASNASFWRKSVFVLLAFAARRPVIFHLHGGGFKEFYDRQKWHMAQRVIRYVLDGSDRIVVVSESWKRVMSTMTCNPCVVVVPNPAQVVHMSRNRMSRNGKTGRNGGYVLFLSRINRQKGIFDLLEAVARVRRGVPDVRLKCAGDNGLSAVAQRAAELGIGDCVETVGWAQGDAKRELLENAAVYVLPSYKEGLPMGVLEAMSAGLPVVSTRVGGIPDVVTDGVHGFLVAPGDIAALAEIIERLLKDPELRNSMGAAAKAKVEEQFLPERVVPQLEVLYKEVSNSRK